MKELNWKFAITSAELEMVQLEIKIKRSIHPVPLILRYIILKDCLKKFEGGLRDEGLYVLMTKQNEKGEIKKWREEELSQENSQ